MTVDFEGIPGTKGYSDIKTDKAGWRYGFVAHTIDGKRIYGKVSREAKGQATFKLPKDTQHLWLVVSGAPVKHWPVAFGRQAAQQKEKQWPYKIKLTGTTLAEK